MSGHGSARHDDQLVYHYCDLHTFISIVRRGELWLADISKSNDSMELDWAKRMFRREASHVVREHMNWGAAIQHPTRSKLAPDPLPTGFDPAAATSYLAGPSIGPGSQDFLRCYAMCFSVQPDSLGQWRGYADDGAGVALGFDSSAFEAVHQRGGNAAFEYDRVIYDQAEARSRVRAAFADVDIHQPTASLVQDLREREARLFLLAPFLKNPTFRSEQEQRLSIWIDDRELAEAQQTLAQEYGDLFQPLGLHFSDRDRDIVPHFRLQVDLSKLLRQVVLGPTCRTHRRDVLLLLSSCGVDPQNVRITRSLSSYR